MLLDPGTELSIFESLAPSSTFRWPPGIEQEFYSYSIKYLFATGIKTRYHGMKYMAIAYTDINAWLSRVSRHVYHWCQYAYHMYQ